jgi:16S rRNA (guanine527-N7)-methyltransferase
MNPLWTELTARANITLTPEQLTLLDRYLDLLFEANEKMNLTRIPDRAAAEIQHIGDALTLLPYLPATQCKLADVGSGGGVPGIPLAIVRPDSKVVLIESTKKKADFLHYTKTTLGLQNLSVRAARAEEIGQSNLRETFDVAIARAVATLNWLAEWCLPLVRKGGYMLAMKGPRVKEEIPGAVKAIKLLGGGSIEIFPANLPGTDQHLIIKIPKNRNTQHFLPRPASMAKGKPLE